MNGFMTDFTDQKVRAGWQKDNDHYGEHYSVHVFDCEKLTKEDIIAGFRDYLGRMYRLRINDAKSGKKNSLGKEWFDTNVQPGETIEFSALDLVHHRPVVSVQSAIGSIKDDKTMSKEEKLALINSLMDDLK